MTIQISHAPPAQSYGGMGVLAGNAQYNRELYPQLVQQDQFAQQMQQRENAMLFQAAVQAQEQERQRQFEAYRQQQAQQQQLRLGQQHGEYGLAQSYLHDQSQYANQRDLFDHQMARDQAAQEARAALELQHQQNILGRQTEYHDQRRQAEESALWKERFNNPFSEYDAEVTKATQAGMQYAPGDEQRLASIRQDIEKMSSAVQSGEFFDGDVLPQFQIKWAAMNRIRPSVQQQTPRDLWKSEAVDVYEKQWTGQMDDAGQPVMIDNPSKYLGTVTKNAKGQWIQTVRPQSGGKGTAAAQPGQEQQGGEQADPWAAVPIEKQAASVEAIRKGMAATELSRAKLVESMATAAMAAGQTPDMAMLEAKARQAIPSMYNERNVPPMIRDVFRQQAAATPAAPPPAPGFGATEGNNAAAIDASAPQPGQPLQPFQEEQQFREAAHKAIPVLQNADPKMGFDPQAIKSVSDYTKYALSRTSVGEQLASMPPGPERVKLQQQAFAELPAELQKELVMMKAMQTLYFEKHGFLKKPGE